MGYVEERLTVAYTKLQQRNKGESEQLRGLVKCFFLVGYVEERPWWPIQSPNKGIKEKAES